MLEGSVRKSGNRVRITAQLIDATTGGHLWAERFDRDLTDIFAVQDDVTDRIVRALRANIADEGRCAAGADPDRTARRPTTMCCVDASSIGCSQRTATPPLGGSTRGRSRSTRAMRRPMLP